MTMLDVASAGINDIKAKLMDLFKDLCMLEQLVKETNEQGNTEFVEKE